MDLDSLREQQLDVGALDETPRLGRRQFLIAGLATGVGASAMVNHAAIARSKRLAFAKNGTFPQGVASGFPYPTSSVLWTRLGEVGRTCRFKLEVAKDPDFKKIVAERIVTARADRDFTARVRVNKLKPDNEYSYRVHTKHKHSPVGRFRTGPAPDSRRAVRIALVTCQSYEAGYYNVHRAIAAEPNLDLVLGLGDYIYESHYYDGPAGRKDTTGDNHDGHVEYLHEYLEKYRLYKSDPDLIAMHQAHPFIACWDDHEVEDNYADGLASSHATAGETNNGHPRRVTITDRRANGYQAFFNSMPRIRFDGYLDRIYEQYRIGSLVDLLVTDERQYRYQQPCNDVILTPCFDEQGERTMLGQGQKNWFKGALSSSQQTWKLWANEVMVMGLQAAPNIGVNNDQWDGYAKERRELLEHIRGNHISNVVALTGDIHSFFAGTATTTGSSFTGQPAIPELVVGSATSHGLPEETGLPSSAIKTLVQTLDPHIIYTDLDRRGYAIVDVTPDELICEFKALGVETRNIDAPATIAKFRVPNGAVSPQPA
jgi:alkaline phosphatase D